MSYRGLVGTLFNNFCLISSNLIVLVASKTALFTYSSRVLVINSGSLTAFKRLAATLVIYTIQLKRPSKVQTVV